MKSRAVWVGLLAIACATPGCYRYSTTGVEDLAPGAEVRVRVTPETVTRVREQIPAAGPVMEGRLLARTADGLLLAVPVLSEVRGMRVEALHQRVEVSMPAVLELELRELDRTRTLLVVGGGLTAVAALVIPRLTGEGSSRREDGTPPAESRVGFEVFIPVGR